MVWIGGLGLILGVCIQILRGGDRVAKVMQIYGGMSLLAILWMPVVMTVVPKSKVIFIGLTSAAMAISCVLVVFHPRQPTSSHPGIFPHPSELAFAGSISWFIATWISLFLTAVFWVVREFVRGLKQEWMDFRCRRATRR